MFASILTLAAACGSSPPPAPALSPPSSSEAAVRVTGSERFGWSQPAPDLATLRQYQYVLYVDGTRTPLSGSRCDSTASSGESYACSAPLPRLTPGAHVLELATLIPADGTVLESMRSGQLRVVMGD